MRVRRLGLVRLREDERGAVLAIVAISLIAVMGMLVLTFDLGRGVALKRNMVNAADSGALAAARECALANGYDSAKQAATELIGENNGDATLAGFQLEAARCSGGALGDGKNEVTVVAAVPQEYFFAQIFGFTNGTVSASATAEWELGAANPVPLKLDQLKVEECTDGHIPGFTGNECYFEFEKEKTGSQRGWLDFPEGWPIEGEDPNPMDCTSQKGGSNDLVDYISQMGLEGSTTFLPDLWEIPIYACAAGGVPNDAVQAMQDWLLAVAEMDPKPVVYFPEVACDGTAAPCFPWVRKSGGESYPVIKFVGMRVVNAWSGSRARQQENCEFARKGADVFCVQLAVASPDDPTLNGGVVVRLID
jgi:Flp pilus assembly protein TadG